MKWFSLLMSTTMAFVPSTQADWKQRRALAASRKDHDFLSKCVNQDDAHRVMLLHTGRHLVHDDGALATIAWQPPSVVRRLVDIDEAVVLPAASAPDPALAVDVSSIDEADVLASVDGKASFVATRQLMVAGTPDAVSDAGRARALLAWHDTAKFCGACGNPTVSREGGAKRVCTVCGKRWYPRIDSVAIALVYRDDGKCLLGRSAKFRPGMYTCISGFVDACETVEDAVRREVFEESGVVVDDVQLLTSQPWPIGRSGSCELMLACVARAKTTEIEVDTAEMEDIRWFSRDEVLDAYDNAVRYANHGSHPPDPTTLWIPGSYAIAHHLVKHWLDSPAPQVTPFAVSHHEAPSLGVR